MFGNVVTGESAINGEHFFNTSDMLYNDSIVRVGVAGSDSSPPNGLPRCRVDGCTCQCWSLLGMLIFTSDSQRTRLRDGSAGAQTGVHIYVGGWMGWVLIPHRR